MPRTVLALLCCLATGCATMFKADTKRVLVDSEPRGAVVYQGLRSIGQTPLYVSLDKEADASIAVVLGGAEYRCSFTSRLGVKWVLLGIPFVLIPLIIDVVLQETDELDRDPQDAFLPAGDLLKGQSRDWTVDPGADSDRCFANFQAVFPREMFASTTPQSPPTAEIHTPAILKQIIQAIPQRPDKDIIAYVRRGTWFGILVHGGLNGPLGMSGAGLEVGYGRHASIELGFGEDFLGTDRDGPELGAMLRVRGFSVGERWLGLGGGAAQSIGTTSRYSDVIENARWLAFEAFVEQPFTPYGVLRASFGTKRLVGFDSCMSIDEGKTCPSAGSPLYFDIGMGFHF